MNRKLKIFLCIVFSIAMFALMWSIKQIVYIIKIERLERQREIDLTNEQLQEEFERQASYKLAEEMSVKYKDYEAIEILLKKNQDWSEIRGHFTEEFLSKYNEEDGFLGDKNVEDVKRDTTYVPKEIDYWDTDHPEYIVTIDGKRYRYYLKSIYKDMKLNHVEYSAIDDIKILDIVDLDSDDKNIIHGVKFLKSNSKHLLLNMMFTYDKEAGLTKHFLKMHNNFDGLFDRKGIPLEHTRYDGKLVKKFRLINGGEGYGYDATMDFDNRVCKDVKVLDVYRELVYHYDIYFKLDKNGYLDDYNMVLTKIEDMRIRDYYIKDYPTYSEVASRLCNKGRDWTNLPISDKFREKFNSYDGIFGKLPVDYVEYLCETAGVTKYPVAVHLTDGSIKYFGLTFVLNGENKIDDIQIKELNVKKVENYTLEEMQNLF